MGAHLEAKDLGEFTALFKKCGINGKRFLALTMEDLVEMGLDNAYVRKQILKEVAEQKGLCPFDDDALCGLPLCLIVAVVKCLVRVL